MTPQLNASLAKAKAEIPEILANRNVSIPTKTGREIRFTYAELEEIQPKITPVLSNYGLVIVHQMQFVGDRYCLVSTLRHESGEQIDSVFPLPSNFGDAKELGTQVAYGRRYNTLCLLDITVVDSQNWEETKRKIAIEIRQESGLTQKVRKDKDGSILHDLAGVSPTPTLKNDSLPSPALASALPSGIAGVPDRKLLNAEIESILERKNISVETAKDILFGLFGVRSRQQLTDEQLAQFLDYLKTSSVA